MNADNSDRAIGGVIGCGVLGLIALLFFMFGTVAIIEAGHIGVLTTWGKVEPNVLGPGLNVRMPIAQGVTVYDVRVQKDEAKTSAGSKDLQEVKAVIALNYHPNPAHVMDIHNQFGPEFKARLIDPAIQEAFKATTAQYTASELITKREEVKIKARDILKERLATYYIIVDELNIVNFDFSEGFNAAIEASNVARQNVIRLQQELEQAKVNAEREVVTAEANARARVALAGGQADAAVALANGEAQAVLVRARADAQANTLISNSVTPNLLALRKIELVDSKWTGGVPTTVLSDTIPFLTVPIR